jgi:hypothetical protein
MPDVPVQPPPKRNVKGGRVTPKGGPSSAARPTASTRYTPPVAKEYKISRPWVPVLMFGLLGLGLVVIFLNYLGVLPALWWTNSATTKTNNWWLLIGLGSIMGGIMTATKYH